MIPFVSFVPLEKEIHQELRTAFERVLENSWYIHGKENQEFVTKDAEEKQARTMWGTMARNIRNAVEGVSKGFEKAMYMKGVGYKASVKGSQLVLVAGYSHDVIMDIPAGLTVVMGDTPTEFTIKGMDKCLVGQFADKVHKVRKADPYKGKGIFYKGERVRRKEGKKK